MDGVVCSPIEIKYIRSLVGKKFIIVTPGIRIGNLNKITDDQTRIMNPVEAIKNGA